MITYIVIGILLGIIILQLVLSGIIIQKERDICLWLRAELSVCKRFIISGYLSPSDMSSEKGEDITYFKENLEKEVIKEYKALRFLIDNPKKLEEMENILRASGRKI